MQSLIISKYKELCREYGHLIYSKENLDKQIVQIKAKIEILEAAISLAKEEQAQKEKKDEQGSK